MPEPDNTSPPPSKRATSVCKAGIILVQVGRVKDCTESFTDDSSARLSSVSISANNHCVIPQDDVSTCDVKLTGPIDAFDHPFWDCVRDHVSDNAMNMRRQGFFGAAMLPMNELEYTGIIEKMAVIDKKVTTRSRKKAAYPVLSCIFAKVSCNDKKPGAAVPWLFQFHGATIKTDGRNLATFRGVHLRVQDFWSRP